MILDRLLNRNVYLCRIKRDFYKMELNTLLVETSCILFLM